VGRSHTLRLQDEPPRSSSPLMGLE
jgi:hypothetical protein